MKKKTVSLSWPASLSGFAQDEVQKNFTRGKLSVFYKGETSDHRFFSDSFSEEIIKTLPYTPVVSYYDEEKDDFVGHATEQQILGIVDPCTEPVFEKLEDGNTWAICDVVLYTERPDKVGELAKKIEGHSQSLELDPRSVKYVVNYDERKHFKNIEFTAGKFVGVSVLGNDQKPAFTGSAFFTCDKQFEEKMNLLKNYCESKGQKDGGELMNIQDFVKASWGEISSKVSEAVQSEYQEYYTYVVDMYADCGVFRFYSLIDGSSKLMKVFYTVEGDVIKLGNIKEVRVDYVDIEEPQAVEAAALTEIEEQEGVSQIVPAMDVVEDCADQKEEKSKEPEDSKEDSESPEKKDDEEEKKKEEEGRCEESENLNDLSEKDEEEKKDKDENAKPSEDVDKDDEDEEKKKADCEAAPEVNAELTQTEVKEVTECEHEDSAKDQSSASSFTDSERAELENLKKEKKVELLNSFKDNLSEEEYADFESKLDNFTEESLELELLRSFKNQQGKASKKIRFFSFVEPSEKTSEDNLDSLVSKYLSRRG